LLGEGYVIYKEIRFLAVLDWIWHAADLIVHVVFYFDKNGVKGIAPVALTGEVLGVNDVFRQESFVSWTRSFIAGLVWKSG
jgi:hypothetical protein